MYTLLNAIVYSIRQISVYNEHDILFSGDFNVNMLQLLPKDVSPTFLECSNVEGQKTLIYTSLNNAPSSFGDNSNGYNPTNIDFALFYPKPLIKKTKVKIRAKLIIFCIIIIKLDFFLFLLFY